MSFTVTASTSSREVSFSAGSAMAALEQALRLLGAGGSNVRAIDGLGRVYTPAALSARVLGRFAESPWSVKR